MYYNYGVYLCGMFVCNTKHNNFHLNRLCRWLVLVSFSFYFSFPSAASSFSLLISRYWFVSNVRVCVQFRCLLISVIP